MGVVEFFLWVLVAFVGGVPAAVIAALIFQYRQGLCRGCLRLLWRLSGVVTWPLKKAWHLYVSVTTGGLVSRIDRLEEEWDLKRNSLDALLSSMQERASTPLGSDAEDDPQGHRGEEAD